MNRTLFFTIVALSGIASLSHAAGPRERLAFRDAGLYAGFTDYSLSPDSPFDFLVVPGNGPFEGRDNTPWSEGLKRARKNGIRVIADLNPQVKLPNGEYTNITLLPEKADDAALDAMVRVMGEFLAQVDRNELYAITLSEEQIYWNGQAENLNRLYDKMKAKYDVPIYQWLSPSSTGSPPGTVYPNLKSDGWVADEYYLDQPYMEQAMRAYIIQQKPIVQTVWAGGEKATVPFVPTRFWQQVEVCRKYDIPTSYFAWYGKGSQWGWSEDAPRSLKRTFESTLQVAARAPHQDRSGIDMLGWDFVPWEIPVIKLAFADKDKLTASYREPFAVDRVVRFINDAEIRGFANLRWDSSPIELRPRKAGKAEATIVYTFESPFQISQLTVSSAGFATPEKDGTVSMSILDSRGKVTKSATLSSKGTLKLIIPGAELEGRRFKVVLGMSGTAASAGDILAGISSLDVDADVVRPKEKQIELPVDAAGEISYEEDLRSMSIYHTAEIKNIKDILSSTAGLWVLAPARTVEVVQEFGVPRKVALTRLRVRGNADEAGRAARLGIGVSLNGVDVLARKMSAGPFNGELEIDLGDLKERIESQRFFVHLFLEGSYGLITSYCVDGEVVQ